jgi:GTPase SAR1 family protein
MVAELPTKEELKKLYDEKGWEALTWYAWRNALRALPVLGVRPLKNTWSQNVLQHSFQVCQVSLLLANVPIIGKHITGDVTAKVADVTYITAYMAVDAAAVAESAYAAASFAACSNVADAIDAADYAGYAAIADFDINYTYAAISDYNFLISLSGEVIDHWYSQPLWLESEGVLGNKIIHKPIVFDIHCEQLTQQLNSIGLDFVAADLNKLWSGTLTLNQLKHDQAFKHWQNYAKNFSDADFQSTATLLEAIFGAKEIGAVRILLLGPGGAGKTTLAARLQSNKENKNEEHKATVGINYLNHQPLTLSGNDSAFQGLEVDEDLQLYLWDFGGQTLFHGMHKSFLHENCVYVLVVDSRHEQAPDEWLQQIYYQAGLKRKDTSKAFTVLLVSNEYDNCRNQQNEQRLTRQFPEIDLQFFYFPCNDPSHEQLKTFKQALLKTAEASRHSVSKQVMDAGDSLKEQFKTKTFLGYGQLRDLLQASLGKVELSDRIKQLETLGWIINTADTKQEESYCLNPAWVVDHAYHLLYWLSVRPLDTQKETGQQSVLLQAGLPEIS